MEEKKQRKELLNFRDIFHRRRNSAEEINSAYNSRRNSNVGGDPLKNVVSLMTFSKALPNSAEALI